MSPSSLSSASFERCLESAAEGDVLAIEHLREHYVAPLRALLRRWQRERQVARTNRAVVELVEWLVAKPTDDTRAFGRGMPQLARPRTLRL